MENRMASGMAGRAAGAPSEAGPRASGGPVGAASAVGRFLGSRGLTRALLAVYLVVLAWIILLKMQPSLAVAGTGRSLNLVPFAGALVVNGAADYGEVVQNLLAFVPFGLYAGMLAGFDGGRGRLWRALVPIAATSLAFETLQYAFAMGASDVTDLLANTAGGAVGIALYALVRLAVGSDVRALRLGNALALAGTALVLGFVGLLIAANA